MLTAQFNDSFPPIIDGVANGVRQYAYWLNRKYGDAYVVVPEFPNYTDREEYEVIRYKSIPFLPRKPYRIGLHGISFECRRVLSEIPLEIIHAHTPFSSGVFARQIAKEKRIPLVATFHSQYYYDFKDKLLSDIITQQVMDGIVYYYEKADAVWTVNKRTVKTLKDYGFRGDVDVVRNGTDMEMPADYEARRSQMDKRYKLSPDDFVLLYTGQLIWHKNLRLIAESLLEIKKNKTPFRMFFVGAGEIEMDLKNLVFELGLRKEVIFTGQIMDRDLLKSMYARADLFLFPSLYDTFGQVVREAAALRCPSVLIEGCNAAEDIIDSQNGFLCENTLDSFTRTVLNAMGNRDLLGKVSDNALATLPEGWEKIVDESFIKYQDIIRAYQRRKRRPW
ncbi:MAG: glycosyltransferase [Clostridia bacterium]